MEFAETVESVGKAIEGLGIAVIVLGVVGSMGRFVLALATRGASTPAYTAARRSVGRSILLGLELLVAGDIIRTVVVDPSFTSVGVLAVIVAIRTFLSFTLEVEISSRWPWQGEPADHRAEPSTSPR